MVGSESKPCPRCGSITSAGHGTAVCKETRERGVFHTCCPGDCELDHPFALWMEVEFWEQQEIETHVDFTTVINDINKKLREATRRAETKMNEYR